MFSKTLSELEKISQAVGNSIDLVQGGGGNTSVKLNDNLMAVKASGFRLSQITASEGYVVVDYSKIKNYYETVDLSSGKDFEKESVDFVKSCIVPFEGLKVLRPSVEAGFHSILNKYVIHTHPVYANMLCCSQNGSELMNKAFKGKEYGTIWIPYINPGFCLTLKIKEEAERYKKAEGRFPEVIFMENHGLIVHSDCSDRCIWLHTDVNQTIKDYFAIGCSYPELKLEDVNESKYISGTEFVKDFIKENDITEGFFDRYALYPDQLVYLNSNAAIDTDSGKLTIDTATGQVAYNCSLSEARTMEETLLGYFYVLFMIKEKKLPLKTMSEKDVDFIRNWESESYRKSLVKDLLKNTVK